LLDLCSLRGRQLESFLRDAHVHASQRGDPQLSSLRLARILLAIQKYTHVVLGGRNDERANIQVGLQERSQHRRGTETFRKNMLILALPHGDLIHAWPV